jgi:iron(III) transport system substrate-binding protein
MKLAMAALSASGVAGLTLTAAGASTKSSHAVVPLVLYSAQGYDSAMAKAFTAATGIPVNLDDDSTGPLLTKIQTEKNNPQWNLLWVDGTTAFAGLDTAGLLAKNLTTSSSVHLNSLGLAASATDGSWIPTGVTMMGAVLYNKTKIVTPPTTYSALLSTKWRGQLGMNDPTQSGPTFPLIAGVMNELGATAKGCASTACAIRDGEHFFTTLKSDTGLVIHPTNGPTIAAITSGQINMGLVQSSAAAGAAIGTSNLGVAYLSPATILPSAIGVDAKASKVVRAEAERFINFVLSPAGQHVMQTGDPTGDSLYYPVVKGTNPLPALPSIAHVKTQAIDPYVWGPQETKINNWFTANITQ